MKGIPDDLGNPNQKKHLGKIASGMHDNPIRNSDAFNEKQSKDRIARKNRSGALKHLPSGTNAEGYASFHSFNEKPW